MKVEGVEGLSSHFPVASETPDHIREGQIATVFF